MNKQYIKRQITLHKLGIPMTEKVKEYYDYFHHLLGNINDLEELIHKLYPNIIFWRKGDEVILKYDIKNELFDVYYHTIWEKFGKKYLLEYKDIGELFTVLLGEAFNLRVTTTETYYTYYGFEAIEKFQIRG